MSSDASLFHRVTQTVFLFQLQSHFLRAPFRCGLNSQHPCFLTVIFFYSLRTLNAVSTLFLSVRIGLMADELPRALGINKDAAI